MLNNKTIFEFEVSGRKRGFKFGMYAIAIACEQNKCEMDELMNKLGWGDDPVKKSKVNLLAFLHLLYGGAVHYSESAGQEIDFKPTDVSDWLGEIGFVKAMGMISEAFKVHDPKNSESPSVVT